MTGAAHQFAALFGIGEQRSVTGKGETESFHQTVHRIRGEHSRARPAGRASDIFDCLKLEHGHSSCFERTDAFEDVHQVDRLSIRKPSGAHCSTADKDGRDVDPHGRHQHVRHNLVAIRYANDAIEAMSFENRFHRIGYDLARGQTVLHTDVAHGDAVIDANRIELEGHAAGFAYRFLCEAAELLPVAGAGGDVDVRV